MKDQSQKNHARYVIGFHIVTFALTLALLIGSFVNLYNSLNDEGNLYSASLIVVAAIVLALYFYYIRSFPLKVQDRTIRVEENFRHYILTGKTLDSRLSMSQIIALRFAPDKEFPQLAKRAVEENLQAKQIKAAIKQWKSDHHRA